MPHLNIQLRDVLIPAYGPCPAFEGSCREMRWAPGEGHVPRGFFGATGSLEEVKLVLVVAEPGDPHPGESHGADPTPDGKLQSAYRYAYECCKSGRDLYHRNIRLILDLCWPGIDFDRQMRRTWITESLLCSALAEGSPVPLRVTKECRSRYLDAQLALFSAATVVALGQKAQRRLNGRVDVLNAVAAAPPGCNRAGARESWEAVARIFRSRAT